MTALTYPMAEAAQRLGVSYDWLRRQCRSGRLPCHRMGRRVKFTDADLDAILDLLAAAGPTPQSRTAGGLTSRSAAHLQRVAS